MKFYSLILKQKKRSKNLCHTPGKYCIKLVKMGTSIRNRKSKIFVNSVLFEYDCRSESFNMSIISYLKIPVNLNSNLLPSANRFIYQSIHKLIIYIIKLLIHTNTHTRVHTQTWTIYRHTSVVVSITSAHQVSSDYKGLITS